MNARELLLYLGLAALCCGCGSKSDPPPVPDRPDCNPLLGTGCLSGVPTAFYERGAADSRSGRRLDLPAGVMPASAGGEPVAPLEWNRRDGWSPAAPVHLLLERPVDPACLVPETDPAASLDAAAASTLLLDGDDGAPIAHFAEVDLTVPQGSDRQALMLRPWTPLGEQRRVVVVLTRRLVDRDGRGYQPTPTMQRLLDGERTGYGRIDEELDTWLGDIEAATALGLEREELLAVWHYHTASRDWTWAVALAARDAVLAAVGPDGPELEIERIEVAADHADRLPNLPAAQQDDRVEIGPMHSDVALRLRGHFLLPSVLTEDGPLGTLDWTGQGNQLAPPQAHEPAERPFVVVVPPSALAAAGQARLLLYGHGLLRGACAEGCVEPGDAELMPHLANALGVVQVATDWWGLSQAELVIALDAAQDFSRLPRLTDKLVMGAVAPAALTRAVRRRLLADERFFVADGQGGAVPLADAGLPPVYYGNSLGGIMGTTAMALHPTVERAVFNVPGAIWSTMMNRSVDFGPFRVLVEQTYSDPYERALLVGLIQSLWDLSDPAHFARHLIADPLPGTPAGRRALWAVSRGDCQVPNLVSGALARLAEARLVGPGVLDWYGVTGVDNPAGPPDGPRAAVVQWDSRRGTLPPGNKTPPEDNGAHYATRWMPEFQQLVWRFLLGDGTVDNRVCIQGGRDGDGALPCDLEQTIPASEAELPPLPEIPPP